MGYEVTVTISLNGLVDTYIVQNEIDVKASLSRFLDAFIVERFGTSSGVSVVSVTFERSPGRHRRSLSDSWNLIATFSADGDSGRDRLRTTATYFNDNSNDATILSDVRSSLTNDGHASAMSSSFTT